MDLTDIDSHYVKYITSLHSNDYLITGGPSALQLCLEEAIKSETGQTKDLSALVALAAKPQRVEELKTGANIIEEQTKHLSALVALAAKPQRIEELKTGANIIEESKTTFSSNSELELDLFKDDLMCIICNGMGVRAGNLLLECSVCHSLYHQECHHPVVTRQDSDGSWICQNCKDSNKKIKIANISPIQTSSSLSTTIKAITNPVPPAVYVGSNSTSSSYKSTGLSISKSNASVSSKMYITKPLSVAWNTLSNIRNQVEPNINIISAAKRIRHMKKKAAKLHEKRKLTR